MTKLKLSKQTILNRLPSEPDGWHYEVEEQSSRLFIVWLVSDYTFDFKGDIAKSAWGKVKSDGRILTYYNEDTGHTILDAYKLPCYSVIKPRYQLKPE